MADDLGQPVRFKGPGQWRSQAETAQQHSRPPDAALEVLPEAQRSEPLDDEDAVAALAAEAEQFAAEVLRFNPNHAPPGSPAGGQFAASSGSGGKAGGAAAGNARQAAALRKRAHELRAEAAKLSTRLDAALKQLKTAAAAHRQAVAAAAKARKHAASQVKKQAKSAKSATYNAAHPGAQQQHRKAGKAAAATHQAAATHVATVKQLHGQVTRLRRRIHELRAQADKLDAQAAKLAPPAHRAELELEMRSEPVDGLDWDPVEYLLRAGHVVFDPNLHPRKPDGEWAPKGGAGTGGGSGRPAGWPANAPPPRPAPKGMSETAASAEGPSLAELANMVTALREQLSSQEPKIRTEYAQQLHGVVDQIRTEEKTMAAQVAAEVAAEEKAADLKLERRKALIRTLAIVAGLIAVGVLIIATAGAALPPIAEAGIAVGPLIGGELVTAFGEASTRRKARARIKRP